MNKHKVEEAAVKLHEEGVKSGMLALLAKVPTPMVVQEHKCMMDDSSPVEKEYFVEGGVCGFAWVWLKANTKENRQFINGLKEAGLTEGYSSWGKDDYRGGYTFWVAEGGQSMERKVAYAGAYANILIQAGLKCQVMSRMD